MKCTLRKVYGGIVATIDERPKETDHWVYIEFNEPIELGKPVYLSNWFERLWDKNNYHLVIASTIPNVGKELTIFNTTNLGSIIQFNNIDINKEYDYTETETKVIIEL